jgi:putative PIN family toxin of toxin-antitoxin system
VKAVLDTNVVVSGIFFGGVPRSVLELWSDAKFELCLSPSIFDEYVRTCERLSGSRLGLEYLETLATLIGHGTLVPNTESVPITADADDDKFMACARQVGAVVVSGDQHLLAVDGWEGVEVLTPRDFLTRLSARR